MIKIKKREIYTMEAKLKEFFFDVSHMRPVEISVPSG